MCDMMCDVTPEKKGEQKCRLVKEVCVSYKFQDGSTSTMSTGEYFSTFKHLFREMSSQLNTLNT